MVHNAESGESERKSAGEADLQRKLAAVEAARGEDPDQLHADLARLREIRIELERQRGGAAARPDGGGEYDQPQPAGR